MRHTTENPTGSRSRLPDHGIRGTFLALAVVLAIAASALAQQPCPTAATLASDLLGPSKVIQTPLGHYLVAEVGTSVPNSGRISIVDRAGQRRTLLAGLPSARVFVGDLSGPSGLLLRGRTLLVLNGQGDVTLSGPVPGTEIANPAPASPLFSSVLAVHFSAAAERATEGFELTLADHQAIANGEEITVVDALGQKITIELVVNFADYAPEPLPFFPANVRHSHPYGIVEDDTFLYVVDAGFNSVRRVDRETGADETIVRFPPVPNPLPFGPPMMESVPTSIRWAGDRLLVSILSGAPFVPGYSTIHVIEPDSAADEVLITGLTSAIDVLPLAPDGEGPGLLTLEYSQNLLVGAPGRLQYFDDADAPPVVVSSCLRTPSSLLFDARSGLVILAEIGTGRLLALELP